MSRVIFIATATAIVFMSSLACACRFPPNLWCSSPDITKECEAEKPCSLWQSRQSQDVRDVPLVRYELYFESLCPGCRMLLTTQLYPAWNKVKDIVNVTLTPYGNAKEVKVGSEWNFTCQHGPAECVGNVIETCALSLLSFDVAFPFIYCLETNDDPSTAGPQCAQTLGIDFSPIDQCSKSAMGNALEHKMAERTDALNPPHEFVPWVVLNGVHNSQIQDMAETDSLGLICQAYTGIKPDACTKTLTKHSPRV